MTNRCFFFSHYLNIWQLPIDGSYIHIHRRRFDDSHVKPIWLSGVVQRPLETFREQNCDWLCRNHCDDVERTRRIWSSSTTSTRWVLNSTNCSKIVPSVNELWRRSPERVSSSGSSTDPPPCKTRRAFTFPVDNHQRTASQERLFWFRFDNDCIRTQKKCLLLCVRASMKIKTDKEMKIIC